MNSLLLFRHSDAEDSRGQDSERRLTEYGRSKLKNIAEDAKGEEPVVNKILCSPFRRARESAEIIADIYSVSHDEIIESDIIVNSMPREVIRFLKEYSGQNLVCVGHMPTLAYLAAEMTGGYHLPLDFNFYPGQFLVLDFKNKFMYNKGILRFYYNMESSKSERI